LIIITGIKRPLKGSQLDILVRFFAPKGASEWQNRLQMVGFGRVGRKKDSLSIKCTEIKHKVAEVVKIEQHRAENWCYSLVFSTMLKTTHVKIQITAV
jgi:hypothetical protein